MTFGLIPARVACALPGLLLLAANALGAVADHARASEPERDGLTVEQIVRSLKEGKASSIAFEEATYSALLTEPLIVRGVLRFAPPSRLEKDVREPYRERYVIDGDRVTFESDRKHVKKAISLEDYPALRNFVDAFRATFTGDVAQLKQIYETKVEGNRRQWTLRLQPRDASGKAMVESIQFSGSEGRIATVTILSPDGDRTVMRLSQGSAP